MIKVWAWGIALNLRVELEIRRLKKFGAVEKVDSFCFFPLRYFCVLLRDPLCLPAGSVGRGTQRRALRITKDFFNSP
jgi:hypothetical protein